jgi:hypothetical protein
VLLLQPDNSVFNMITIPELVEDDLRFCVLDYSNTQDVDFFFVPIIFLDVFTRPSADLRIGRYRVQMPLDWSIVIADKDFGYMEIIELKDLRDRPFEAAIFNPITGFIPNFGEITHLNNFPDVTWNMPKLKYGHILVVPLENKRDPACAFFVKDIHRLPDSLDITKIFA